MSVVPNECEILSDSNDSDVFVLKQIKPVNALTVQQALIIKYGVLNSIPIKKNLKKKNKRSEKHKTGSGEKKSKKDASKSPVSNKTPKSKESKSGKSRVDKNKKKSKDKKNLKANNEEHVIKQEDSVKLEIISSCEENQDPKPSNDVFEIFKSTPRKKIKLENSNEEKIQLSPGISRKIKKFNILSPKSPKSPKLKKRQESKFGDCFNKIKSRNLLSVFNTDVSDVSNDKNVTSQNEDGTQIDDFINVLKSCDDLDDKKYMNGSEQLSFFLKQIIHDEMQKQIELQVNASKNGKPIEKLLSVNDCEILKKFFKLEENACMVLVRMLCRKKEWHRLMYITYNDISENLENEFNLLNKEGFVDTNVEDEDLKTQLNLLSRPELLVLCKAFNAVVLPNGKNKKGLINSLIESTKKQKSVMDMLRKGKSSTRVDLLKSEIKKQLGMCIRINKEALLIFNKLLLLFSFAHYFEEEEKRFSNQLFLCLKVCKMGMWFPSYKLCPTVVFETCEDLVKYQDALWLRDSFEIAINNKRHDEFKTIAQHAKVELIKLLNDYEYCKRYISLEPYLRKFSAGSIYTRIITRYCKLFKKQSEVKEIIEICQLLLGQDLFCTAKKGEWYEILAKALESLKDNNSAAEVLVQSLNDPDINEVQKVALQLRGQLILKKKTNLVNKIGLREVLDDLCTMSIQEPPSIEITGKTLENRKGFKSVFVEENENGKMLTSVEERAISYYRSLGFTNGFHVEGFIVQSIYFLLFFDIIYGASPPGVFQSPYQEAPLDLNSKYFYLNRKNDIDSLVQQMSKWDMNEVETKLKNTYQNNYESTCVISWKEHFTPELFCVNITQDFIKCITMPILALICQRFAKNFRVTRSGFPDLTLWNSETGKCKFVEVKGPNDKLSPGQRVWLDFLRGIGVDCEVCNVKNTSSKTLQ